MRAARSGAAGALDKALRLRENRRRVHEATIPQAVIKMTSRFSLLGATLLVALLSVAPGARADVLEDILERGTIRVGVAEFVPWTIRTRSGELVGFEIDVAEKIAADMGVTPEFKVYEWDRMIAALEKGEIDVIAGGMAITPERALRVNFSRPLAVSGVGIATNVEKTRHITSLDELDDERIVISVVADTLAQSVAESFFGSATITVRPAKDEAEADVLEGRAHAYLASVPVANYLALTHPDRIDVPLAEPLMASSEGLAIRKGEQEFLNFLDAWVTARQTDKWLETARAYWFETMDWMPRLSE